jgi:hypothetical protein
MGARGKDSTVRSTSLSPAALDDHGDLVTEIGEENDADSDAPKPTFAEYWRVLSCNEYFRIFFISYCIDNIGNWLNFIACLSIMDQFGKSYYTAVYLSLRLLPPLLLAGI